MDMTRGECQYCGLKYKLACGGLVHHERACLPNQVEEIELAETMARVRLEHKGKLIASLYNVWAYDLEPSSISATARERKGCRGVAGPIPFTPSSE
jgi:hypothetical protein